MKKLVFGLVLFSLSLSALAINKQPAMVTFKAGLNMPLKQASNIDLKRSLVQVVIPSDVAAGAAIPLLSRLVKNANKYNLVAGFNIVSEQPLDHQIGILIAKLALRSSFLSTKFSYSRVNDWNLLFATEKKNKHLITTVYGPQAMMQLLNYPSLAPKLVMTRVNFIHVFNSAVEHSSLGKFRNFWKKFAMAAKSQKLPMMVILLDSGKRNTVSYQSIVRSSLQYAGKYLFWAGGANSQSFEPISLSSTALNIWRNVSGKIRGYSYKRIYSPSGLYQTTGATSEALTAFSHIIKRTQYAGRENINYLSDAEGNVHTSGVLYDLARTIVINGDKVYMPPVLSDSGKFNILIKNPSKSAAQIFAENKKVSSVLAKAKVVGIFDYCTDPNKYAAKIIFAALHKDLMSNNGYTVLYNASLPVALKGIEKTIKGTNAKVIKD
jgi:hypothetical protein